MKSLITLFSLFVLLLASSAHADSYPLCGHENETPLSCSQYFKNRNYQLPYAFSDRVDLKQNSEVERLVEAMYNLIWNRSFHQATRFFDGSLDQPIFRSVQIFNTKSFLGKERQFAGKGVPKVQFGYAYAFDQPDPQDSSKSVNVRVIELDLQRLQAETPLIQALVIFHLEMHFVLGWGDDAIDPLIEDLYPLMKLYDQQISGVKRVLTADEMKASQNLQSKMVLFGMDPSTLEKTRLNPNGGGAMYFSDGIYPIDRSNFIGIDAAVNIENAGAAYYFRNESVQTENRWYDGELGAQFFAQGDVSTSFEHGNAGQNDVLISGSFKPIAFCRETDVQGHCAGATMYFPVKVTFLGDQSGVAVKNFEASLVEVNGGWGTARDSIVSASITGKVLNFVYEKFRENYGSVTEMALLGLEAKLGLNPFKNGVIQLTVQAGGELGGGYFPLGPASPAGGLQNSVDGKTGEGRGLVTYWASGGVRLWDTLDVRAFINEINGGDKNELALNSENYGVSVTLNPPAMQGWYVSGVYQTERQQWTEGLPSGGTQVLPENVHSFVGVNAGFQWDFVNPPHEPALVDPLHP